MGSRNSHIIIFIFFVCGLLIGCYSFKGTSIPPEVKTVTINFFENQSRNVVPAYSQTFTENLKDKFNSESNLILVERDGDWEFNGVVTLYEVTPIAPTGNESTALNRLTISVRVEFLNRQKEEEDWQSNFSRFADFDASRSLTEVEDDLIAEINDQLAIDIFNRVASDW